MLNLPNLLTFARILAIPVICGLVFVPGDAARWAALLLYVAAAITDWLDGWLARRMNIVSPLGRMLDPIADKLLVAALLLVFANDQTLSGVHLIAAGLILVREILISGLREFAAGQTLVIHVSMLAKYKTTAQLLAMGVLLAVPLFVWLPSWAGLALLWLSAALTVWTGLDYFMKAMPQLQDKKS